MMRDIGLDNALPSTRMNREKHRKFRCDGTDSGKQRLELLRGINIGRSVQRDDSEAAPCAALDQAEFLANTRFLGDGPKVAKRINHDVANKEDALARPTFFEKVLDGVLLGHKKIVRQGVGKDTV